MRFNNQPEVIALTQECGFIEAEINRLKSKVVDLCDKLDEISVPFNLELNKEYQDITKEASALLANFDWLYRRHKAVQELTRLQKISIV